MNSQVEQVTTVEFVRDWIMSGDHEVSDWERKFAAAIDARLALSASLASQPPVLDEREVKRAFTFAFAVGFQWASECSCVSAASIDEAWSEYTAIRNLGGPDDVA